MACRMHTMDRVRPDDMDKDQPQSPPAKENLKDRTSQKKTSRSKQRKGGIELVLLLCGTVAWLCVLGVMSCLGQDGPLATELRPLDECVSVQFTQPDILIVLSIATMVGAYILDSLFLVLYPVLCIKPDPAGPSPSTRWFFAHFLTNGVVSYFAWEDVYNCFTDVGTCGTTKWSGGTETVGIALGLHFYHICFFHLTAGDWLHHGMTAVLTTPPILVTHQARAVSLALFFMTGLPGGLDYFLLTMVKLGWLGSMVEKQAYVVISVWIRGPGVLSAAFLGFSTIFHTPVSSTLPWWKWLGQFWNLLVTYWNAMYFMHSTLSDYYKPGRARVAS
eukprot:TRINITY_DN110_c0_g1_i1.p1 TRINITY_DN110_c0_g1~~TRINITY_DN110_c0_g1_i1.p1  ORF type:complete len:332 (+),score=35.62 TRINITY_DN110_c0_g1_i1:93-1088(+)